MLREEPPLQLFRGWMDIRHNRIGIDCKEIKSKYVIFGGEPVLFIFGCRHKDKNVYFLKAEEHSEGIC